MRHFNNTHSFNKQIVLFESVSIETACIIEMYHIVIVEISYEIFFFRNKCIDVCVYMQRKQKHQIQRCFSIEKTFAFLPFFSIENLLTTKCIHIMFTLFSMDAIFPFVTISIESILASMFNNNNLTLFIVTFYVYLFKNSNAKQLSFVYIIRGLFKHF